MCAAVKRYASADLRNLGILNDSSLWIHQHHAGLVDTKECECGQGVDDAFHYFFQFARFSHIRESLMKVVDKTWSGANCQGSPRCSVALLLAPACLDVFTKYQCEDTLNAVFTFIDQFGRRLWYPSDTWKWTENRKILCRKRMTIQWCSTFQVTFYLRVSSSVICPLQLIGIWLFEAAIGTIIIIIIRLWLAFFCHQLTSKNCSALIANSR